MDGIRQPRDGLATPQPETGWLPPGWLPPSPGTGWLPPKKNFSSLEKRIRKQWQCIACILACLLAVAHVASAEDVLYKINTAWTDEAAFEVGDTANMAFGIAAARPVGIAVTTAKDTTYKSGETSRTMLPGDYEVAFSDVDHYVTPVAGEQLVAKKAISPPA